MMKQLIVNGDDFGLHPSVNEGIIASHVGGCLTSTTIMAGGNAFDHAVSLAKQYPGLGIGVHLALVGTSPVARGNIPTLLTRNGTLYSNYLEFTAHYLQGKIAKDHIYYELWCQMQKVVGQGIAISHIDSHQHLHVLPGMAEIISRIAREFHIEKIRIPAEGIGFAGPVQVSLGRVAARAVLTACSRLAKRYYRRQGFIAPEHFYGMLAGGAMSRTLLQYIIARLPEGVSEIMVHPGLSTKELAGSFTWGYHWQEEMEALRSQEVLDLIQASEVQLINYREFIPE
jgi:hopanoid biosynthesis associated protein HpnK